MALGDYAKRARAGLRLGFGMLRAAADRSGERDVLRQLYFPESCMASLGLLSGGCESSVRAGGDNAGVCLGSEVESSVKESDFQPLSLLTWNIAGAQTSSSGPDSWTEADKIAAMRQEVARWDPDVVALQECVGECWWSGLDACMEQVGVARAHEGFVHLYVRRGLRVECVGGGVKCPWVVAELQLRGGC